MVVFTCNHCGDSLQKPKVAKHYETTCKRNPINLTCVDCFTDFKLQEYVGHTKCLTEADRYSAKGTASKILKGEVKQTEWVNTVNSIIEQQINAKPGIKNILQALVNCDNIPRKKVKFLNFMKNAFGFKFNNHDIEQVWNLLEAHKNVANKSKEQKVQNGNGEIKQDQEKTENLDESNQEKKSKKKKKKSEETLENGTTNAIEEMKEQEKSENLDVSNQEKKSKKKRKKSLTEETVENGTTNDNEEIKEQEKTENLDKSNQEKKSKKKKKKSEETVENGTTNGIEEIKEQEKPENLDVSNQDKKSKKKKKKSEETTENGTTNGIEEIKEQEKTENLDESNQVKKSKKKRKSKQHDTETINGAEETPQKKQKLNETSEENDTSLKKKKKRKSSQGGDESPQKKQKPDETETNGVDISSKTSKCEETNDLKLNDSQSDTFSFKQVIIDILTKKSKGLSKEALQNKVFKKYEAIMGPIENKEILLKKYNKKLKAVKEVTCDNDKYTLSCSSE